MTTFDRSGHYRTNRNGNTFWVSGHAVSRDDWPSWVPQPIEYAYTSDDAGSPSRNITIPNARCPVCGDPVFFFMAANGGRVFFDDLGPPWPKHGCTVPDEAQVPGFSDSHAIAAWQAARRARHAADATEGDLPLAAGQACGTARIVRRTGAAIAVLGMKDGRRAFTIAGPWPGWAPRTVYYRDAPSPDRPERLEHLLDDMTVHAASVIDEVPVPPAATADDLTVVAEGCLPDIEAWAAEHLAGFRPGPRFGLAGRAVGVTGRLGRSRIVILPLVPWFDVDDDARAATSEQLATAKAQIEGWTRRAGRALHRSMRLAPDTLYQDLFVWAMPGWTSSLDLETYLRGRTMEGLRWHSPADIAKADPLPGVHVVQALAGDAEAEVKETRRTFPDVTIGENAFLVRTFKASRERRWLAAALRELCLERMMAALANEGVTFEFRGTGGDDPRDWGQQAILPDGLRLLVILHLSTESQGLAFAHFDGTRAGDLDGEPADALFHAKGLQEIISRLGR